jgi:PPK2 family polyphosphate:nucleotide phosphotransferase
VDLRNLEMERGNMKIKKYAVSGGKDFKLSAFDTKDTGGLSKSPGVEETIAGNIQTLAKLQDVLFASNRYGVLVILQGMDGAGKDGIIKHIMSGLNPQGVVVTPFKVPTTEELDHDYLWRSHEHLPERGNIAIFNRSYYEDVLVVKVHHLATNLPDEFAGKDIWQTRYRQLRDYERYMHENGIIVIKIFLHLSRDEQAGRLLDRIDHTAKNWKFSAADLHERQFWDLYQKTYEEMIIATAADTAPWYIVPADHKWFARLLVSEVLIQRLQDLSLKYPELDAAEKAKLLDYRKQLVSGALPGVIFPDTEAECDEPKGKVAPQ